MLVARDTALPATPSPPRDLEAHSLSSSTDFHTALTNTAVVEGTASSLSSPHEEHATSSQPAPLLRLRGGKGGFGSNLRAAGKQKLTDNFDACRDLNGRRIRHKTAEQKLEDWKAEAQERELEKIAAKHLKEAERAAARAVEVEVNVEELRGEARATVKSVKDAVRHAVKKTTATNSSTVEKNSLNDNGNGHGSGSEEDKQQTQQQQSAGGGSAANASGGGSKRNGGGAPVTVKRRRIDALEALSSEEDDSGSDGE